MYRRVSLLLVLFALSSTGCASIDEAMGVPDATSWSYFQAPATEVTDAAIAVLRLNGYSVEGIEDTDEGTVLSVSLRSGAAAFEQIRVQSYSHGVYSARGQIFPHGRRLPESLRYEIARLL